MHHPQLHSPRRAVLPPEAQAQEEAQRPRHPRDRGRAHRHPVDVLRWDPRVLGAGDRAGGGARQRGGLVDAGGLHLRDVLWGDALQGDRQRADPGQHRGPGPRVPQGAVGPRAGERPDVAAPDQGSGEADGVHNGGHGHQAPSVL